MTEWEYLPTYLRAQVTNKEMRAFLKEQMPELKRPPRYMAESMIPELNQLGAEGWELVHMEPVANVRKKGDVLFNGAGNRWSNVYFCVFKRPKAPAAPAQTQTAAQLPAQQQPPQIPPATPQQPQIPPATPQQPVQPQQAQTPPATPQQPVQPQQAYPTQPNTNNEET